MASLCNDVELFVDGELPTDRAEAFRNHLPDCAGCQRAVANLLQLDMLGQHHAEQVEAQVPAEPPRLAPSARWRYMAPLLAAPLLAALVVVLLVRTGGPPAAPAQPGAWQRPTRPLEVRFSHSGADRYRQLEPRMMTQERPPKRTTLEALRALQQDDPEGLIVALLEDRDLERAESELQALAQRLSPPDLENYQAVVELLQGRPAEALRHVLRALEQQPRHSQALWNRGLALRELRLPLLAARTFEEVASLEEPGWAEEARLRAEQLQASVDARRKQWHSVFEAGRALLHTVPGTLPEGFSQAPIARVFFYDSVRSATTREQVQALLPLARELDARAGGHVLEDYVRRVAVADFSRRAPLAREYAALAKEGFTKDKPRQERLLSALLEAGEDDLLLGTLVQMNAAGRHLQLFEAKAAASNDTWFQMLAAQQRAAAYKVQERWEQATQALLEAYGLCLEPGLEYRCLSVALELSSLYLQLQQFDDAHRYAEEGWRQALQSNEWFMERALLWNLAQASRFVNDMSMARALYLELLERDRGVSDMERRVHQHLADIALNELQLEEARREIDAALATGEPLSLSGAFTLSDIARLRSAPGDEAHLQRALETAPQGTAEHALALHALGRFLIEREVERGKELLRRAVEVSKARGLEEAPLARRARTYSFTSLLMEAGRRNAWGEVLELLSEERSQELPHQCLLAATVDSERTLLLVRGASGELRGHYDEARREPLGARLEGLVPEALLAPLSTCPWVAVLARPPLHGRAGLLPPELAWSYLTRTSPPPPPRPGPAVHLVVSEVALPPDSRLERLNPWPASFGEDERPVTLSGSQATPSRVLSAMQGATEIDLATHGTINERSDASYLVLAPGREGWKLAAPQVRKTPLPGAPFVVLAACHAAHTTYALHEPLSLPAAFIQAGARGVLAATEQLPDREAAALFNAVRERMRSGEPPARALREERVRWLREHPEARWVESVLLFE